MIVRELAWKRDMRDRRLSHPYFAERVPFDLELATSIARAVEECAAELIGARIPVDLFPPARLESGVWIRLCDDGLTFDLIADCGDLTFVVLRHDARKIVACIFGETAPPLGERVLSSIEVRVFDRFIAEIANGLSAVCGSSGRPVVRASIPAPRDAYCELRFGSPLDAVIGIALREKRRQAGPTIAAEVLAECSLECSVQFPVAAFNLFTIAGLTPGDVVPLQTKVGPYATLNVGRDPIAAGEGGILGERTAFKVHELI